jgi:hypothetical protein
MDDCKGSKERMILMSTQLGFVKLYWSKEDFGKMAKLKDITNLAITRVEFGQISNDETVEITITTPMDNVTTNRVKVSNEFNNGVRRYKEIEDSSKNNSKLDFKEIVNKKREEKQEKTNDFNDVLLNNLESLRELFFQVELDKNNGYYELNIYPTSSSKLYRFKYDCIENVIIRGGIKEKTKQSLLDFTTEIILEYNTDVKEFEVPEFNDKWIFNIDELSNDRIYINCETQNELNILCKLLEENGITEYIKSEDFIRYGNRTCAYVFKERNFDKEDEEKYVCYITGIFSYKTKIYKFKNIDFSKMNILQK